MTDEERIEAAILRYNAAAHAMQSGVAMKMNYESKGTEPKHLRVGVNSALVDSSAIATLLMQKGVFTMAEYTEAVADAMEAEVKTYEDELTEHIGSPIKLG